MKRCAVTGSFDPMTGGHIELIRRAAALFDKVEVVMLINEEKEYMFTVEERLKIANASLACMQNVVVHFSDGTAADFMTAHNIPVIVRGIRNADEFAYEQQMAEQNRAVCGVETLWLAAQTQISSGQVKKALLEGLPVEGLLPEHTADLVRALYLNDIK